jgi:hypothetical protein
MLEAKAIMFCGRFKEEKGREGNVQDGLQCLTYVGK